jgi:hypothetical protein
MKTKNGEVWEKQMSGTIAGDPYKAHRSRPRHLLSQENADAATLEEIPGRPLLAKGSLYQHLDDKSGGILSG